MGRRKIEIKAIKDDRNRSVTFLKRKGGLFKKAHELSVLCSVDVAVFIFGNNKKLYEYSSADMQHLITRYQYHGGPNEHKGPADFNGGQNDDDDDEDGDGTPPRGSDGMESHMMPPHYQGQPPQPYPHIRHQTASASPPIPNGVPFQGHAAHLQRSHTPQPAVPSRPGSRGDMRRMGPGMMSQPVGPHGPHPGITYMPTPPIYNPSAGNHSNLMPPQPGPYPFQPPQQQQQQPYMEERRPSAPPAFNAHPPPQPLAVGSRPEPSPPQPPHQLLPPHSMPPHMTSPQPARRHLSPQPPPPVEPRTESAERPQAPLINTDTAIKKMSQRKSHSIFTPIEENRSILSQHLASFASEPQSMKNEAGISAQANAIRSQSVDNGPIIRNGEKSSPHLQQRSNLRNTSISSLPDTPSNASSLKINTSVGSTRPKPPRLTVQIPDGGSEAGSATGDSNSPRNPADAVSHAQQRHGTVVLPPPSPSATTLLSAGATGPPNPFARPVPQQNVNGDTPVSALPSRFLNNELLPSPSSFYPEWNFRGSDNNTLPSPLNFATPVVGTGPSFLRDDGHLQSSNSGNAGAGAAGNSNHGLTQMSGLAKRKSPDLEAAGHDENHEMASDPKRLKVER